MTNPNYLTTNEHTPNVKLRRRVAALALAATVGVIGHGTVEKVATTAADTVTSQFNGPTFSAENISHQVQLGDNEWNISNEVNGSEHVDPRTIVDHIKEMPENADVYEDGILDQGEILEIPISVER